MLSQETAEAAKDNLAPQVMADGGIDTSTDWDTFTSRVVYEMEGSLVEQPDPESINRRATEARLMADTTLEYDEVLKANIINLDSWLRDDWAERRPGEMEIDGARVFVPDYRNGVEVRLDLFLDEVVEAAEQRANEDATHPAYVLGSWSHLADEADHIKSGHGTIRKAFERVTERDDAPKDATDEEYGGGRR